MSSATPKSLPRWGKWLIYIIVLSAASALILSQLPRGAYPTDLTRIGKGQPALVLAYDINSMAGMQVMELFDDLRDEYAGRVELLVADLGVPDGRSFAQQYKASNGIVVVFLGNGSYLRTIHIPQSTDILRQAMEEALSGQTQ